jgi:uncharacterized lipoprotein NlpE involved in copper resistance
MIRSFLLIVGVVFALTGCNNQTQEGRRWVQISKNLNDGVATQPFDSAKELWSSAERHGGTSW